MSHVSEEFVEVALEGGPPELPARMNIELSDDTRGKIKIPYLGGIEHFEPVGGFAVPLVYRWTMRTRIAE
jgi:hypothetical protein